MRPRLVFLSGSKSGSEFELGEHDVTIGRNPGRTIAFAPNEELVSTNHATIRFEHGRYILCDEGSLNGTFINGSKVVEQELHHGDTIDFGLGGPSARFVAQAEAMPATAVAGPGSTMTRLLQDAREAAAKGGRPGATQVMKEFGRLVYERSSKRTKRAVVAVSILGVVAVAGVFGWGEWKNRQLQQEMRERIAATTRAYEQQMAMMREQAERELAGQKAREQEMDSLLAVYQTQLTSYRRQVSAAQSASSQDRARVAELQAAIDSLSKIRSERERFQEIASENKESVLFIHVCDYYHHAATDSVIPLCGSGTGFYVDEAGFLLTNKHVVQPWKFVPQVACYRWGLMQAAFKPVATEVLVWPAGSKLDTDVAYSLREGELEFVGIAPDDMDVYEVECVQGRKVPLELHGDSNKDLALLRVTTGPVRPTVLSRQLPEALDPVMVYGFPLGTQLFEAQVAEAQATIGTIRKIENTIQHTAPAAHGNSGGPVFSIDGEVIGVLNAGMDAQTAELVIFAIKIDYGRALLESLR